mgnify:CR=1 FL=1
MPEMLHLMCGMQHLAGGMLRLSTRMQEPGGTLVPVFTHQNKTNSPLAYNEVKQYTLMPYIPNVQVSDTRNGEEGSAAGLIKIAVRVFYSLQTSTTNLSAGRIK